MPLNPSLICLFIVLLIGSLIVTRLVRCWKHLNRKSAPEKSVADIPPFIFFAELAANLMIVWTIWRLNRIFQNTTAQIAFFGLTLWCVAGICEAWLNRQTHSQNWKAWLSAAIFPMGAASLFFGTIFLISAPVSGKRLAIAFPLKEKWNILAGGVYRLTNYHHGNPVSQNYAIDMVFSDVDKTEGQTVFAPVSGRIVGAINDQIIGGGDSVEGNLIVIEMPDRTDVWLAHLQQGSLKVTKGENVLVGQPIAAVGRTGNAEKAHLHIHAQWGDDPVALLWGPHKRFPIRGDRLNCDE